MSTAQQEATANIELTPEQAREIDGVTACDLSDDLTAVLVDTKERRYFVPVGWIVTEWAKGLKWRTGQ